MGWFDRFRRKRPSAEGAARVVDEAVKRGNARGKAADRPVGHSTAGWQTQLPDTGPEAPRRQFVIGLDFGTAYTKVVIGETSMAYAVPFPNYLDGGNPYLLPGIFSMTQDGHARLGAGQVGSNHSDLKMRLLDGDRSDDARQLTAIFIALVLQHARAWFFNNHGDDYRQFRPDWCVNVGLPTHQYHDDELKDFYRDIVKAAWLASTKPEPLTERLIDDCFVYPNSSLADDNIGLFPEFVAQVNSYVKSPQRQADLHLLIDVGAGTVDVALFNVHENDQGDLFPIFAKSVSKYGVNFLQKAPLREEVSQLLWQQIKSDIDFVKTEKYPEFWQFDKVLPFFLCGGGSQVSPYRDLAARMVENASPCKLRKQDLPEPQRLVAPELPAKSYHRLSVAYGLSFDAFDIGQIVPEPETSEEHHGCVGRTNELCPLCRGTGGARGNDCRRCDGRGWLP